MKTPKNRKPRPTKADRTAAPFRLATTQALLHEHVALLQLDVDLADGLMKLVPKAIQQASEKRPDTRLLRLLVRYSAAANRRLAAAAKNAGE
jgi:hypothetical protein